MKLWRGVIEADQQRDISDLPAVGPWLIKSCWWGAAVAYWDRTNWPPDQWRANVEALRVLSSTRQAKGRPPLAEVEGAMRVVGPYLDRVTIRPVWSDGAHEWHDADLRQLPKGKRKGGIRFVGHVLLPIDPADELLRGKRSPCIMDWRNSFETLWAMIFADFMSSDAVGSYCARCGQQLDSVRAKRCDSCRVRNFWGKMTDKERKATKRGYQRTYRDRLKALEAQRKAAHGM